MLISAPLFFFFFSPSQSQAHCVADDDPEFLVVLLIPPECYNVKHVPPYLTESCLRVYLFLVPAAMHPTWKPAGRSVASQGFIFNSLTNTFVCFIEQVKETIEGAVFFFLHSFVSLSKLCRFQSQSSGHEYVGYGTYVFLCVLTCQFLTCQF